MFTTAGAVSRVILCTEGGSRGGGGGSFAAAAVEFAAPPTQTLLDYLVGSSLPGFHPAGRNLTRRLR